MRKARTKKPDLISQADWDAVDSPELTAKDFAAMRPAAEVVPEVVALYRRTRGRQKAPKKVLISLRVSSEVLDHFRALGKGWQTRIDEALKNLIDRK